MEYNNNNKSNNVCYVCTSKFVIISYIKVTRDLEIIVNVISVAFFIQKFYLFYVIIRINEK